jgi:5-methylcytosine-specific restriction protein A
MPKKTNISPFAYDLDNGDIKTQRRKARELRSSQWWKRRCDKGQCYYCGQLTPPKELTMDHIVPLSRGGKSTRGNIVPACKTCNNKKKQLLPIEWEAYLQGLKAAGAGIADKAVDSPEDNAT